LRKTFSTLPLTEFSNQEPVPMNMMDVKHEIEALIAEFGGNPFGFLWVLRDSENENLDFAKQNERWAFIKTESWHSLDLADYQLWAVSDNGDLIWWNGDRVIAMAPRDREFVSTPVRPSQFLRLLKSGKNFTIFPEDLLK
jgi:hypothetical protein